MKTKLIIVFTFIIGIINGKAQNEADCAEKLSIFNELCKAKDFDTAYEPWMYSRKNCASFHNAIYIRGEQILNHRIENAKTPAEKEAEVRDLVKMFVEFDTHFPDNNRGNKVRKAMTLFENNVGTPDEIYNILHDAFKNDKANFTNPKALYVYFEIYVNDFEAGKNGIQLQDLFNKYDEISDKIDEEEKKLSDELDVILQKEETGAELTKKEASIKNANQINIDAFQTIRTSMDNKIAQLATCDRLIPFLSGSFEEKKGDAEWLRRAADRLDRKGCSSDPLFSKISEKLHQLSPTAKSSYNLGVYYYNKKNTTKSLEYFNQSAELHKDGGDKAKVYYTVARNIYGTNNKSQARAFAEKALAAKPSFGEANVFIAQLYANSANDCGNDPFEKRAIYWLAAQTARKAGTTAGNAAAASYDKLAPSKADIHSAGRAGESIRFNCWVGRSVTVPNL